MDQPIPRPPGTHFDASEAVAVFALSVALLFGAGMLFLADLGLAGIVVGEMLFIAGPAVAYARLRGRSLRAASALLGFRSAGRDALLGAALVGISFWYLSQTFVWPIAERYLEGDEAVRELEKVMLPEGRPLWVGLLVFVTVPAVCEEILLRGAVARGLRDPLGLAGAVAISSLLFGLLHVIPAQILSTAVFGIPLAYAALASGSVVPSMVMHALNNAIAILLAGGALPFLASAIDQQPSIAALAASTLTLLGCLFLWRGRQIFNARAPSS